jgi:hypothetical protein
LTLRRALARQIQIENGLTEEQITSLASREPDHYTIVVASTERNLDELTRLSTEAPQFRAVYLQPARSKAQVLPTNVAFLDSGFVLHFPREIDGEPTIGATEKKVRFFCQLGELTIKKDFDLRKMHRDGRPDL